MYSCCIITTSPCCAHIDQAVGLCSHIVFYHFLPWTPLLSPPQPSTVQHGLVVASALSDAFMTMNGNLASPVLCEPPVSGLAVTVAVYPTKNTTLKIEIIFKMYFITLCFLFHRELLVFAKCHSHTHTLKKKNSAHKLKSSFLV